MQPLWGRPARWLVGIGKAAAAIVIGLMLLSFALPLVVRGPRFASLVKRYLPPMQGTIDLTGGSLGATALWAYAFGRPVPIAIEGLSVKDPEGVEVLRAQRLTTRLEINRKPLRVFMHDLRPGKAMWRFSRMKTQRRIGFLAAFMRQPPPPPPPGTTPRPPAQPPAPPAPSAPGVPRAAFGIASAQLDGLEAIFDFWGWGLRLDDIKARGFLKIELGTGKPPITFDAREVDARRGGHLRILGGDRATVIPFDRAAIERVGTADDAPASLLLIVKAAMTGASELSGQAIFPALFPGRPPGATRGLKVDATWKKAGAGLSAALASRGLEGLAISGDDALFRAKVTSNSFRDIDGSFLTAGLDVVYRGFRIDDLGFDLSMVGPPVRVALDDLRFSAPSGGQVKGTAALEKDGTARLDLSLDRLQTEGVLPPYLRPLLGGQVVGALSLRANRSTGSAHLVGIDVTLDRIRRGPLPKRLRIQSGKPSARPPAILPPPVRDQLLVHIGEVGFERGLLEVSRLGATFAGASIEAPRATLLFPRLRKVGEGPPEIDVAVDVRNLDIREVIPGTGLAGVLGFRSQAKGPLDDLVARVSFLPSATLTVFDQPYKLPHNARVRIRRGDELSVTGLHLGAPGGGRIVVEGGLVVDRSVDLSIVAEGHRLDRVPFVSAQLPSLGGTLAGRLHVGGHPQNPMLDGTVRLAGVTLRGTSLGAGALKLTGQSPGRSSFTGSFFEQLAVSGNLGIGQAGPAFDVIVNARKLVLDPFLPELPFLRAPRLRVGGRLSLSARSHRSLELDAAFDSVLFAMGCKARTGDPRGPGCLVLENRGPISARARDGAAHVTLDRARFVAPGSDFQIAGSIAKGALDARREGHFGLDALGPLLEVGGRRLMEARGVVSADISARGRVVQPVLNAELEVKEPLRFASPLMGLEVGVPRGHIAIEPLRVRSRGLSVALPGAKLEIAGEAPAELLRGGGPLSDSSSQRPLALRLAGTLDASLLARVLPTMVASARGPIEIAGRVDGTPAQPVLDGEATLGAISITTRPNKNQPALKVAVHSGRISARGSRITIDRITADVSPGGNVVIGPAGRNASIEVVSLSPATIGKVDIPVVGKGLNLDLGWLRLDDGALDVSLKGDAGGALALAGNLELGAGRVSPQKFPKAAPAPPRSPAGRAPRPPSRPGPPPMKLDLRITSDGERFVVDPGWLPDLHLGLDVRVGGTMGRPSVAWDAEGKGAWSAFALFLFRLFS